MNARLEALQHLTAATARLMGRVERTDKVTERQAVDDITEALRRLGPDAVARALKNLND